MPSNIEMKARARSPARLEAMTAVLSGMPGILLYQADTFCPTLMAAHTPYVLFRPGSIIYSE
jgi:hypothetical protein